MGGIIAKSTTLSGQRINHAGLNLSTTSIIFGMEVVSLLGMQRLHKPKKGVETVTGRQPKFSECGALKRRGDCPGAGSTLVVTAREICRLLTEIALESELSQKAEIVLIEQTQVVDPVL
jgi:hypothetical protein